MLQELSVSARKSVTPRRIVKVQHALSFDEFLPDRKIGLCGMFAVRQFNSGGLVDGGEAFSIVARTSLLRASFQKLL